ncbi:Uncharacterised protein [uncultured archaeon]|nr:Uncharacterised protein [uncultured archaeon]
MAAGEGAEKKDAKKQAEPSSKATKPKRPSAPISARLRNIIPQFGKKPAGYRDFPEEALETPLLTAQKPESKKEKPPEKNKKPAEEKPKKKEAKEEEEKKAEQQMPPAPKAKPSSASFSTRISHLFSGLQKKPANHFRDFPTEAVETPIDLTQKKESKKEKAAAEEAAQKPKKAAVNEKKVFISAPKELLIEGSKEKLLPAGMAEKKVRPSLLARIKGVFGAKPKSAPQKKHAAQVKEEGGGKTTAAEHKEIKAAVEAPITAASKAADSAASLAPSKAAAKEVKEGLHEVVKKKGEKVEGPSEQGEQTVTAVLSSKIAGNELLALLLNLNVIDRKGASRLLSVEPETIDSWAISLEANNWITIEDKGMDSAVYRINSAGRRRILDLERKIVEKSQKQAPIKSAKLPSNVFQAFFVSFWRNKVDALFFILLAESISLFMGFYRDPNNTPLNFLVASVLLSAVVLIYRNYREKMRFAGVVDLFVHLIRLPRKMVEIIINNKSHFGALVMFLTLLASVGRYTITSNVAYLYLILVSVGVIILIYHPRKNLRQNMLFLMGLLLFLTSFLVMLHPQASVSQIVLGEHNKYINFAVGFCILLILMLNQEQFGLGVKTLTQMLSETESISAEEPPKEEPPKPETQPPVSFRKRK